MLEGSPSDRLCSSVLTECVEHGRVEAAGGHVGTLGAAHRRRTAGGGLELQQRGLDTFVVGRDGLVVTALEAVDQAAQVLLLEPGVQLLAGGFHRLVEIQLVLLEPPEQPLGDAGGRVRLAEPVPFAGVGGARTEKGRLEQRSASPGERLDAGHEVRIDGGDCLLDTRGVPALDCGPERREPGLEPLVGLGVRLLQRLVRPGPLEVGEHVADYRCCPVSLAAGRQPAGVVGPAPVDGESGGVGERCRGTTHRRQRGGVPAPRL